MKHQNDYWQVSDFDLKWDGHKLVLPETSKATKLEGLTMPISGSASSLGGGFAVRTSRDVLAYDSDWKLRWQHNIPAGAESVEVAMDPAGGVGILYGSKKVMHVRRWTMDGKTVIDDVTVPIEMSGSMTFALPDAEHILFLKPDSWSQLILINNEGHPVWKKEFRNIQLEHIAISGPDQWVVAGSHEETVGVKKFNYVASFDRTGKQHWKQEFGEYAWEKDSSYLAAPVIGVPLGIWQSLKQATGTDRHKVYENRVVNMQTITDGGVIVQTESNKPGASTVWRRLDKDGRTVWSLSSPPPAESWGASPVGLVLALTDDEDHPWWAITSDGQLHLGGQEWDLNGRLGVRWDYTHHKFIFLPQRT